MYPFYDVFQIYWEKFLMLFEPNLRYSSQRPIVPYAAYPRVEVSQCSFHYLLCFSFKLLESGPSGRAIGLLPRRCAVSLEAHCKAYFRTVNQRDSMTPHLTNVNKPRRKILCQTYCSRWAFQAKFPSPSPSIASLFSEAQWNLLSREKCHKNQSWCFPYHEIKINSYL